MEFCRIFDRFFEVKIFCISCCHTSLSIHFLNGFWYRCMPCGFLKGVTGNMSHLSTHGGCHVFNIWVGTWHLNISLIQRMNCVFVEGPIEVFTPCVDIKLVKLRPLWDIIRSGIWRDCRIVPHDFIFWKKTPQQRKVIFTYKTTIQIDYSIWIKWTRQIKKCQYNILRFWFH